MPSALLRLREFTVVRHGTPVFEPLSLTVEAGTTTIVHGANRSGKTSLYGALLRCDPDQFRGRLRYDELDLTRASRADRARFWSETSFVAEDAPSELVERQLLGEWSSRTAGPLSSGSRLRVALDQALAKKPRLLVLDEAPELLDELARQELLHLLKDQQAEKNLAILVICHNPAAWRELAAKRVVEISGRAPIELDHELLTRWRCSPENLEPRRRALLSCQSVSVAFTTNAGGWRRRVKAVQALHAVDFELGWGRTVAVVGASPSGKSTLALALAGLLEPSLGRVLVRDTGAAGHRGGRTQAQSRTVQLCFDDPRAALDPRMTALQLLSEAVELANPKEADASGRARELLEALGLEDASERYPSELSWSEACLLSLARALSQRPAVLLLDNALAGLDEPIQKGILALLHRRGKAHAGCILITNNLTLAYEASDHLAVMYGGTLVEWGRTRHVFDHPAHPYSRALLRQLERGRVRLQLMLEGAPPDPAALPSGCTFHPRCARFERGQCDDKEPALRVVDGDDDHLVACFRPHSAVAPRPT